jgi:hypothetical protein
MLRNYHKIELNHIILKITNKTSILYFRKSKTADDKNLKIGSTTHTSLRRTNAPSWEELVDFKFGEKTASDDGTCLS